MGEISSSELFRLQSMTLFENQLRKEGFLRIAGVDEAGRGPLAGPVVAAACILPDGALFPQLNDSKKLSEKIREALFAKLTTYPGLIFGIGIVDPKTIDRINILQATFLAMQKAVKALAVEPDYLLIDGNKSPKFKIPSKPVICGDALSISIAAASILAKVTRDRLMEKADGKYPKYGFKKHKGYGTEMHLAALQAHGPSPLHRKSFAPIKFLANAVQRDVEEIGCS